MLTDLLYFVAMAFGLVLAPLFLVASVYYRRQFKGVVLQWKKTGLVVYTILTFMANLLLFVLACFFISSYMGRIDGVRWVDTAPQTLLMLGIASLLLMFGSTVFYFGIQNFSTQFVTQQGIYLAPDLGSLRKREDALLPWDQIKDYYLRSDYPVTVYQFLVQQADGTFAKRQLKVPFYVMPRFEVLLEMNLKKQQEIREQSRSILRKMSRN